MHADVTAFAYEWQHGSRAKAQEIACRFIDDNASHTEIKRLSWYTREGLVQNIEGLRSEGREEAAIICEMFVLARFAPAQSERLYRSDELPDLTKVGDESEWDSFEGIWRTGNHDLGRRFAVEFVAFYRPSLLALERYVLEDMALLADSYRALGRYDEATVLSMWALAEYQPQTITGYFDVKGIANAVDAAVRSMR